MRATAPSPAPAPLASTTYGRVADHLRAEILAGHLSAGARLKIAELAERHGLSQMPVREALQQLSGEGLVVISPNRGATVRRMDAAFLRDIFAIREALEGMLVRAAARLATPALLAPAEAAQAAMEAARRRGDLVGFIAGNRAFHRAVEALPGNGEALRLLELHANLIGALRVRHAYRPGRQDAVLAEHRALLAALAARDGRAAVRIHDGHLRAARDDLLRALEEEHP